MKRIDVADAFGPLQELDGEVRDPAGTDLAGADQARHRTPRLFEGRSDRVRPVELIQVDALDAEPAQRRLDLLADRFWPQVALRLGKRLRWVRHLSALGEDEGTLGSRDLADRLSDDLLGMAQPVDGRGIDPVDAGRNRMLDGRDRSRVVLASPTVGPTATPDGPRAKANLGDLKPARSERTGTQRHDAGSSTPPPRPHPSDTPRHPPTVLRPPPAL